MWIQDWIQDDATEGEQMPPMGVAQRRGRLAEVLSQVAQ